MKFVFIKYRSPTAFANYYAKESDWENSSDYITLTHLISGVNYTNCQKSNLIRITWEEIPAGYRTDAWHFNPMIRSLKPNAISLEEFDKMISEEPNKFSSHSRMIISQELKNSRTIKELRETIDSLSKDKEELKKQLSIRTKTEVDKYIDTLNDDSPFKQARIEFLEKKIETQKKNHLPFSLQVKVSDEYVNVSDYAEKRINNQVQKNTEMNLSNVIPNFKFGKLSASSIALSVAGIAFKKVTNDIEGGRTATWVVFSKDTKQLIEVGDLKFDVDFYQIPVQTLNEGDVTILDGNFYIVEKINTDGSITAISPTTGSKTTKLARTNIFNMHFYTKVVSMFDMMGGQLGGGNTNTPFGNINPMMFMLIGDKSSSSSNNMMEMMMMSQMFNGGNNPFVQQPQKVVKTPAVRKTTDTTKTTTTSKKK